MASPVALNANGEARGPASWTATALTPGRTLDPLPPGRTLDPLPPGRTLDPLPPGRILALMSTLRPNPKPHPGRRPVAVVLGDLALDVVLAPARPLEHGTDVPGAVRLNQGGSAANTARWLARLGTRTIEDRDRSVSPGRLRDQHDDPVDH